MLNGSINRGNNWICIILMGTIFLGIPISVSAASFKVGDSCTLKARINIFYKPKLKKVKKKLRVGEKVRFLEVYQKRYFLSVKADRGWVTRIGLDRVCKPVGVKATLVGEGEKLDKRIKVQVQKKKNSKKGGASAKDVGPAPKTPNQNVAQGLAEGAPKTIEKPHEKLFKVLGIAGRLRVLFARLKEVLGRRGQFKTDLATSGDSKSRVDDSREAEARLMAFEQKVSRCLSVDKHISRYRESYKKHLSSVEAQAFYRIAAGTEFRRASQAERAVSTVDGRLKAVAFFKGNFEQLTAKRQDLLYRLIAVTRYLERRNEQTKVLLPATGKLQGKRFTGYEIKEILLKNQDNYVAEGLAVMTYALRDFSDEELLALVELYRAVPAQAFVRADLKAQIPVAKNVAGCFSNAIKSFL
ncbi:MAG: hypothetical protein VYA34_16320 [Myxococcota bacterium]|nr:hypothetical protein [Myxococcota bacterium]